MTPGRRFLFLFVELRSVLLEKVENRVTYNYKHNSKKNKEKNFAQEEFYRRCRKNYKSIIKSK